MDILNDVKTAMRINHNKLDVELTANIAEARAELERAGTPAEVAGSSTNVLVTGAIKTYCKMVNADTPADAERYSKSWLYQVDCLRNSTFGGDVPNV